MNKRRYNREQLIEACKNAMSYSGVLRNLGLCITGGAQQGLKIAIKEYDVDTSHFTHQGHNKNKKFSPKMPIEYYLKKDFYTNSHKLRLRLIKEGLKEDKCESCGNDEWMGKPIPLNLDHIDGSRDNNDLSNLRILCSNCHAQTDTFGAKNRKLGLRTEYKVGRAGIKIKNYFNYESFEWHMIDDIISDSAKIKLESLSEKYDIPKTWISRKFKELDFKPPVIKIDDSGKSISKTKEKIEWPSNEELGIMVWQESTIKIANKLGVSDKAVEKHCRKYGIEKPPRGYWAKKYVENSIVSQI